MEAALSDDLKRYDLTMEEEKQKIEAALPQQAVAKPKRPRKLLVMDLNVVYNGHLANRFAVDYALELMGKKTGAYEVVESNDLDNLTYERIRQFDAVYPNNTVGALLLVDENVRNGLLRFVREGGGLAGNHAWSHTAMDWPEFNEMIGTFHGSHRQNDEEAMIRIEDRASPLTAAFGGKEFLHKDEFFRYAEGVYSREKVRVLLTMDVEKTDMNQGTPCGRPCSRPDNDYALSWIRSYGKGRVFFLGIGHRPTLLHNPAMAAYVLAGIQFIVGDLDADTTPSSRVSAGRRNEK
jgi:type 1 glutamine amidotransferase